MAILDSKEIPDTPPPITAEELRDHEVMEQLLATKPELQEKTGVVNALTKGVKEFKFTKQDWVSAVVFGVIFGVIFGSVGYWAGSELEGIFPAASHLKDLCGAGGLMLAAKSAISHPVAEMSKTFYDKCKDGWSEAQEHNKAVQYLRQRVSAIKMYKQKNYMRSMMDDPEGALPVSYVAAAKETPAPEYEAPERSRAVDAILASKRDATPAMPWVERTEAQRSSAPTIQPTLF